MKASIEQREDRAYNFSSGPAMLPEEVLRRAQAAIWDLDHSGIGVLEHSHRGPVFMKVAERARSANSSSRSSSGAPPA